jgi:beta-lactamase superfamily II metal-dependent hydrolase
MFKIEMLPAAQGDCLWIEYGDEAKPYRILIDTGTVPTYKRLRERIEQLPERERRFNLFIISHVDGDHIEGAIPLLRDEALGVEYDDVWFNGWKHILKVTDDRLGPVQGEYLSALLEEGEHKWNEAFNNGETAYIPDSGDLPHVTLPGGMKLTLLSPTANELSKLRPVWDREVRKENLAPGDAEDALEHLEGKPKFRPVDVLGEEMVDVPTLAASEFKKDDSQTNGSSIAVLAEYDGRRCIFAADAFAPVLEASIDRLLHERGIERLALDALKVSHHGSQKNTSVELLKKLKCSRYLISTSGSTHHHPDDEALSRIIINASKRERPTFYFNYRSDENEIWESRKMKERYEYRAVYPSGDDPGLVVVL